ncbi:hypothetical protein HaLaN_32280, partial [Haematococcus lacustris]
MLKVESQGADLLSLTLVMRQRGRP